MQSRNFEYTQTLSHLLGLLVLIISLVFTLCTPQIVYAQTLDNHDALFAQDLLPIIEDVLNDAGAPQAAEITLSQPNQKLPAQSALLTSADFSYVSFSKASGRFVMRAKHSELPRPVTISGFAQAPTLMPVLKENVERGSDIKPSNIDWLNVTKSKPDQYILDIDELEGKIARRALRAGTPIRTNDVQKPLMVKRGALITMHYKKGRLNLSHQAIAQEAGSYGDIISVQNPRSDRSIKAMISGRNQAKIINNTQTNTLNQHASL